MRAWPRRTTSGRLRWARCGARRGARWMGLLLVLGLAVQSGAEALHAPLSSPGAGSPSHTGSESQSDDEPLRHGAGDDHDPTSCGFCRIASSFHSLLPSTPVGTPSRVRETRALLPLAPAQRPAPVLEAAAARAPPATSHR